MPSPDGPLTAQLGGQVAAELPGLLRFARTLVRDPAAAEDLVQDAVAKALAAPDTAAFRGEASLRTWLHRILFHVAVDRARRPRREVLVDELGVVDVEERWRDDTYTVDPAVVAERLLLREEIEDALARLPFIYRSVVVLHDVERWTVPDIADAVGVGVPAAKQRLRRGRMMLTTAMAAGGERRRYLEGVPMRCWDARRLVSGYLDGELGAADRRGVEAHLATCPTCPPLYASLVGIRDALGQLRDPDTVVPPSLAHRIESLAAASVEHGRNRPQ